MTASPVRRLVTTTLFCAAASAVAGYLSACVLILIVFALIDIAP
ncbi:MAG: hypothetical protein ACU84Q_03945 [Gammaproteobacteria bacterium]